jgi:hypothetical protein
MGPGIPERRIRYKGAPGPYHGATVLRTLPLLLLLASVSFGGDLKAWQKSQREIDKEERKYWDDFKNRLNEALEDFRDPVNRAGGGLSSDKEALYDYASIDRLFAEARSIGTRRGDADAALEGPKAAATLLKVLLNDAKRADKIDAELTGGTPNFSYYTFNQEHACRLESIDARLEKLLPALSRASLEYLTTEARKKCARADGRKSVRRRTALLDALAARADKEAIDFLKERLNDKSPAIRIAAVEAMVACKGETRAMLADPDAAVRRALLLAAAPDPAWFGPVMKHAAGARGFERELCIRLLARISNQKFGHDLAAWKAWHEEYAEELKGGKFDAKNVEIAEAKPTPDPDAFTFYGLLVSSSAACFAIDASEHLAMPADVDVQRTKWRREWKDIRHSWEKEHEAHETVVSREIEAAFQSFPKEFRWGLLTMFGRLGTKAVGEKKLLATKPGDLRAALKLIDQAPAKGWCSPVGGLVAAATLGGDAIDTVVLWHTGDPSGGRFMGVKPAIAAWQRFNRFRKLQVIAIRISNRKEPAEAFMKGVAEGSGGQYLWAKSPPQSGSSGSGG